MLVGGRARSGRFASDLSGAVARGIVALTVVAAVGLVRPAEPSASSGYCPRVSDSQAEVIHLSARLDCGAAARAALKTIGSAIGYYKSSRWYCRWGQGGTRPIRVAGHVYYGGFCVSRLRNREITFLGRRI